MRRYCPKSDFRKCPVQGCFRSTALITMPLQFSAFPLCARHCGSEIRADLRGWEGTVQSSRSVCGHTPEPLSVAVTVQRGTRFQQNPLPPSTFGWR